MTRSRGTVLNDKGVNSAANMTVLKSLYLPNKKGWKCVDKYDRIERKTKSQSGWHTALCSDRIAAKISRDIKIWSWSIVTVSLNDPPNGKLCCHHHH